MQNFIDPQQLFLGDLADDGREKRERENKTEFNDPFVALAHAVCLDQYNFAVLSSYSIMVIQYFHTFTTKY